MNRREFLGVAALGLSVIAFRPSPKPRPTHTPKLSPSPSSSPTPSPTPSPSPPPSPATMGIFVFQKTTGGSTFQGVDTFQGGA
jgi:hypothetical protein